MDYKLYPKCSLCLPTYIINQNNYELNQAICLNLYSFFFFIGKIFSKGRMSILLKHINVYCKELKQKPKKKKKEEPNVGDKIFQDILLLKVKSNNEKVRKK